VRSAFYSDVSSTALRALNYTPEVEALRRAGRRHSTTLGDVFSRFGPAYGTVFTRIDCEAEYGERLLDQASTFATEPVPRIIRGDALPKLEHQRISKWQVLIAGAGTLGENEIFGRSMLADGRLVGSIVGPDTMALWPKDPGSNLSCYTYAFLCTKVGVRAVRSTAYGTKILRLRHPFLKSLPIPLGTDEQIARVAALVRETVAQREAYAEHLRDARALLEKIPGFSEARAMCEQRQRSAMWWDQPLPTLSAWTFAFAGEALKVLRGQWSRQLTAALRAEGLSAGDRSARVACERPHGIDFASQRDVFMMRRFPRRIAAPPQGTRKLFVDADTVLIACDGQAGEGTLLGRAELAACGLTSTAVTEHILKAPLLSDHRWVYALLSSPLGRQLLQSCAVGTSIPKLRMDLVTALPIPDPPRDLALVINRAVDAAIAARLAADRAESEAVRIIEQEVLPAWLA
jgi:hypothetical protein